MNGNLKKRLHRAYASGWAAANAESSAALTELQRAVEAILEDGHMNQEHLARLRAAYEFGFAAAITEEAKP